MNLPLIQPKTGKRLTRRFTGVFPPESTMDKNALKAYIKGEPRFSYKKDSRGYKQYFVTPQEYKYV
jgi:hypothetical protein